MALSPVEDNDTPEIASVTTMAKEEPDPVIDTVTPMVSSAPKVSAHEDADPIIAIVTPMTPARAMPDIAPSGTVVKSGQDFPLVDRSTWAPRADGSKKGDGYFGLLTRPDGRVSSEISYGTTDVTGQEMEIPLLVPTLTAQEVQTLLKADLSKPKMVPPAIVAKAVDFAKQRVAAGKSPFAQAGEQQPVPDPIQAPRDTRDAAALLLHGGGRGTSLDVRKSDDNIISEGIGQTAQGAKNLYAAVADPIKATARIVTGATSPAGVLSSGARATEAAHQWALAAPRAMAATSDILEGTGKLAIPAVVVGAIVDPLTTIPTVALVTGLSNSAEATAKAMGASHETARFVGNLVGAAIATGGIAEHATGTVRTKIADLFKGEKTPADTVEAMKTLGVDYASAVDPEALKSAFRKEAMATHPDRNPDDPKAAEKFIAVKAAYQWLIDNPPPEPSIAAKWKATLTKGVEDILNWRPKASPAAPEAPVATRATPESSAPVSAGRLLTDGRELAQAPVEVPVEPAGDVPLERTPRPGASAPEAPKPAGGVPFVFTRAMTADLKASGYSDTAINRMTPAQAHDILSAPEDDDAAVAGVMGDLGIAEPAPAAAPAVAETPELPKTDNSPVEATPEPIGQPARVRNGQQAAPGGYYLMSPKDIKADPDVYQFKGGGNAKGVTSEGAIEGPWNQNRAGVLLVHKGPGGELYVVNGHHRLSKAQDANAPEVLVKVLEDMTPAQARVEGALTNIAEDKGTPVDAAKVIRSTGLTPDDFQQKAGISTKTKLAKDGFALARLSDPIFQRIAMGDLDEAVGVAIGDAKLSEAGQQAVVKLYDNQRAKGRDLTAGQIKALVSAAQEGAEVAAGGNQPSIFEMMGEERTQNTAVARAVLTDWVSTELAKDKRLFGYVSDAARVRKLYEGGNVLDTDKNKSRAADATRFKDTFDKLANKTGPISKALNEAAVRSVQGEKDHAIRPDLLAAVRAAIASEFGAGTHVATAQAEPGRGAQVREEPHQERVPENPEERGVAKLEQPGSTGQRQRNVQLRDAQKTQLDRISTAETSGRPQQQNRRRDIHAVSAWLDTLAKTNSPTSADEAYERAWFSMETPLRDADVLVHPNGDRTDVRAPGRNGNGAGQAVIADGAGSSQERGQPGQQDRELGTNDGSEPRVASPAAEDAGGTDRASDSRGGGDQAQAGSMESQVRALRSVRHHSSSARSARALLDVLRTSAPESEKVTALLRAVRDSVEFQPRLPGDVGAVRDQEVAHPQLGENLTSGYSVANLKSALNLTTEQAAVVDALVKAKGLDTDKIRFGYGEPMATDALSQYIGEKAHLAPAARAGLDTAQKMAFFGEDPEKIRQATGWYVNPYDGKLRFEVSDHDMALKPSFAQIPVSASIFGHIFAVPLESVVDAPGFVKAYPDLAKQIHVAIRNFPFNPNVMGWYNAPEHRIYISPHTKDPRSVILHELQHVIQDHEGFARGGNVAMAVEAAPDSAIKKHANALQEKVRDSQTWRKNKVARLQNDLKSLDDWAATKSDDHLQRVDTAATFRQLDKKSRAEQGSFEPNVAVNDALFDLVADAPFSTRVEIGMHGSISRAREEMRSEIAKVQEELAESDNAIQAIAKATPEERRALVKQHSAYNVYKAIAGEIESRDVESRRMLTPDQRAAIEPYKAENVAPEDAIYIGAKEPSAKELLYQGVRLSGDLITAKPSPLDVTRPVIGIVDRNGTIQAKNSTPAFNDHDQLFGDKRPSSQRFRVAGDEVLWDDVPSADDYFAVEDYFARRGKRLEAQRSYDVGQSSFTPRRLDPQSLSGADTLWQGVKGSVEFDSMANAIIRGSKSADLSTAIHEIAHVERRQLFNRDIPADQRAGISDEDMRTVENYAGAKDGKWDRNAEERYARARERYFRDGKAPNARLQEIFDKVSRWLKDIYSRIHDALAGIEIPPELRAVFDRLETRAERLAAERASKTTAPDRPTMETLRAQKEAADRAARKPKSQMFDFDDPSKLFQTDDGEIPTESQVRDLIKRVRGYVKEGLTREEAEAAYANDAKDGENMTRAFNAAWTRLAPKEPPPTVEGQKAPEYPPKRAANINLDKFEGISDQTREELKAIAEQHDNFMKQRRGVQTWDATEALAAAVPMPEKVGKPGKAMTAAQLDALGGYMDGLREQLDEVAVRVAAGDTTDETLAEQVKLLAQMQVVMETYAGGTAEAGRSLNILRKMRQKLHGADTDFLKQAIKFGGGKDHLHKIAKMLALFPKNDRIGKYRFIRSLQKPGVADWISWYWFTNLLSGPLTHARNTQGNLSHLSFTMAAKPASAAIDVVRSRVTNTPRSVYLGEIPHELAGIQRGFEDGIKKAAFLMKNGFTMENVASGEFRPPEVPGGLATNLVGRSMDAADLIAQSVRAMSELHAQAYTAGRNAGHRPGTKEFTAFMDRTIANPPVDMMRAVKREALRTVFRQEPGFLTKLAAKMRGDIPVRLPSGRVIKMFNPMKLVIPFVTTPSNIMRSSAEWTPLGFASAPFNKETPRERTEAAGRALTGTMLLAPLALLVAQGLVSGSGPQDKELRDQLYRTGWQPNSIKIGDAWYSYSNFQPLALPLSVMANAFESYQYTGHAPSAFEIAAKTADSVLQQSYLSGLASLQDALENPGERAQAFGEKMLTSAMPLSSLRGQVARAVDPVIRQPKTYTEALEAGDPFLSTNVRARKDAFGDEAQRGGNWLSRLFSPITISEIKDSPLEDELFRLRNDVQVGFPGKTVTIRGKSVALTPEEYDRVLTESGQAIKARLTERIQDRGRWDGMSDDRKIAIIKDVIDTSRAQVRSKALRDVRERLAAAR